jgi:hypothetical protein
MRGRIAAGLAVGALLATLVAAPAEAANPTLHISKIFFDSPGPDRGSNASLDAEYIRIANSSYSRTYTLTGWTIRDKANHVYRFGTYKLHPRESVTIHTGRGTNTHANRYWGKRWYIWNNTGDKAWLKNAAGTTKDTCSYTGAGDWKAC